jgi:hypothetical protein
MESGLQPSAKQPREAQQNSTNQRRTNPVEYMIAAVLEVIETQGPVMESS